VSYPVDPHLSMPFRLDGDHFAVTGQDTAAEVADCVELTLRTVQGERRTLPEFGRPDFLEFTSDRDLVVAETQQAIEAAEPRARAMVERDDRDAQEGILRLQAMWGFDEATDDGGEQP
jgi:phage baseplate assembly protein W